MEMVFIYILLIVLILGIIWHIFYHLMVVFHQDTTDLFVKKVLKDPYKYVKIEEMCYFFRNMVYLYFACTLLYAACSGNIKIEKSTNTVEISNVKDK